MEGSNGLFLAAPSKKGNDDAYTDTIWFSNADAKKKVEAAVLKKFSSKETTNSPGKQAINNARAAAGRKAPEPAEETWN